jgi:hypothetical protein
MEQKNLYQSGSGLNSSSSSSVGNPLYKSGGQLLQGLGGYDEPNLKSKELQNSGGGYHEELGLSSSSTASYGEVSAKSLGYAYAESDGYGVNITSSKQEEGIFSRHLIADLFLNESWRNWNQEFQTIINTEVDEEEKSELLEKLSSDFASVAGALAKQIITERLLPEEKRKIKSISIGGVAGGTKYLAEVADWCG